MDLVESIRKKWFGSLIIICAICSSSTWYIANEIAVKPRDFEIQRLRIQLADLQKKIDEQHNQIKNNLKETQIIPCKNANKITIYSLKSINDQRGINIINALNNTGCDASGILLVKEPLQLGYPDLRYFHKIDFKDAKVIKDYIKQNVGIDLVLNYISEYADKSPKGEFEIWLN